MVSRIALSTLSALLISVTVTAKVVTADNAQNVAKSFLASKGLPDKELVLFQPSDKSPVFRAPSKDSESPVFHIFSDKENREIIVVSGDDIARPILGWSFNYMADENGELPPAMMDWLSEMERQISQARKEGVEQSAQVAREWRAPSSGSVVKQLNTAKWGQNYPFCLSCPTDDGMLSCTGCVPTSYAILMKYYRYPSGARGNTSAYYTPTKKILVPSRELSPTYDWDSMLMNYLGDYTYDQAMAVAKLMADIGAAVMADYTASSTGANYNCGEIFEHFDYHLGNRFFKSSYSAQEWYALLRNHLDNNDPVLYNAQVDDASSAHSFIIDGYTDQDYFCVNWGWAGSCDGAYALDAMNPYDTPAYSFNGFQCAYLDFQPAKNVPVVAKINDSIECPSLKAAVSMIPADGRPTKITMVDDSDIDDVVISNNQNIVLDLNGKKIGVVNYGIINCGNLIVADSKGNGNIVFKRGNTEIFTNYGNLTIYGGEYVNQVDIKEGENEFYRRCIWAEKGSSTHIIGGKFKSIAAVICTNGRLTIDGGEFNCNGNEGVISNYAVGDTVTINGGTFQNMTNTTDGTNYRRVIWARAETFTHIKGGLFISKNMAVVSYGECIIDDGRFETIGNTSTIYNASINGKMTINGGIFVNSLGLKEPKDYRRAFYSVAGSDTYINGGKFSSAYQVLTIVGKAVIDDATVENTVTDAGVGILTGGEGHLTVNYCKIKAYEVLHNNNSYLKCFGGLYSKVVTSSYLGTGCQCVSNDDDATSSIYRYKVINPSGVEIIPQVSDAEGLHFDLNGMSVPDNRPGIHIIRTPDGKTVKVLYR